MSVITTAEPVLTFCSQIFFSFTALNKCVPALLLHQGRWAPVDIYSRFITFMLWLYNLTGTTPSHASSAAAVVVGVILPEPFQLMCRSHLMV